MTHLDQISERYTDLKNFEKQAPQLLLSVRQVTIQIINKIQQLHQLKNPKYIEQVLELDPSLSPCYYEVEQGYGNILDMIREGKFMKMSSTTHGGKRLQKVSFKTFLMKKLCVLLDDLIVFTPKSEHDIKKAMATVQSDRNLKFQL